MIGQRLGPYRIERELGAGGMGTVYAAVVEGRCPGLATGTQVALKVLHLDRLETHGFFKRFLREAEIGKAVVHENVVRTLDCDEIVDGGVVYAFLTMEYVEGQTLRGLLKELERVPEELCRHIGREVAKGLAAIHAAGAIHRDIKPENILITKDHVVKVMDLGVARRSDDALQLSQTGSFVGSIPYAAPECFGDDAKRVDGRVDLHALGLVLYELASGFNPYLADSVPQVLRRILHEEPRRLGEVNPQLSPFFEEVVHRLLAKDPADRFADAKSLLAVLEAGEKSPWWTARATAIRAVTNRPLRRIRIPRDTAVYGREKELETLRALFEKAKAGEGQVVLIEGEAGIGKSRVVDEWIGRLQRDGEELHFLFGGYPPGGAATASGAFATAYREHFGGDGLEGVVRERLGVARGLAPAYAALLLGTSAPAGAEPLTKDSLQTCFIHTTRSLAAERTTVVLVDDLHFAPEEGRALFASLALSAPGQRLLLVGTTRPGVDGRWLAQLSRLPHTTRLGLDRLGPKDLVRLLADAFHSEHLASELAGRIALKSDGNPFFVFEILRGLREGQFLAQKPDGTWVTTKIVRDIRIPSSITDLVNARVADLDEESKNLLDVAACCGFTFDAGVVAAALGVSEIHALQRLARIERRHRLVRSAGEAFVFDHHQIQEALYGGLPPPLAHAYHAAIGAAFEARSGAASKDPTHLDGALCVDIAEHFLKGVQGARARRYLDAALAHLGKAYLGDREVALATAALAAPGLLEGRARAEAILRLAREAGPLEVRGHGEIRRALLDEAVAVTDVVGDDALRGQAKMLRGWAHIADSRYDEAEACMREALALARAAGDRRTEAYAHGNLGHIHAHRGAWAEAAAAHARHLAIGVEIGDARLECNARVNVGNALYAEGRLAEAREQHARALARSREAGNRTGEAGATVSLGNVCYAEGRLSEARALYERALEMHREIGNRQGEANSTSNIGTICHAEGRLPEAFELYGRALLIFREIGNRPAEGNCLGNLGNVLEALDRLPEAREHQEQARAIAREVEDRQGEASATVSLGNLADAQGRHAEAQTYYERALEIHRAIGNRQGEVNCLGNLGGVFRSLGRPAQARAHAERALAQCREIQHRYGEPYVLLGLCAVEAEDGDDAAALRRAGEALAVSRTLGDGACIADSLVEIADLRRRSGDLDAACAALDEALPLLREQHRSRSLALALAMRACMPQGDAAAAEAAISAVGSDGESARMRWLLWTATGTPAHLATARCRLDEALAKVPAEHHEAMRMNLRLHREIAQAAKTVGV